MPTPQTFSASIPVIDMNDYESSDKHKEFISGLYDALTKVGFVAVVNAKVDPAILDRAYDAARAFYARPSEFKMLANNPSINGQRGYVQSEQAQGHATKDHKEFYHIARPYPAELREEYGYLPNLWAPDEEFKDATLALIAELDTYIPTIEAAIAECIGEAPDFLSKMTKHGNYLLRSLHYPANPPPDTVWAAQHTDIDAFTILPRATSEGLQVQAADGSWVDVVVPDGAFIINAGDMLANLTNGLIKSAVHRVISKGAGERYSMVAFIHPRSQDRMDPLPKFVAAAGQQKYPNATAQELLFDRLIDLGLHSPYLLKTYAESGAIHRFEAVGRASPRVIDTLRKAGLYDAPQVAAAAAKPMSPAL